MKYVVYDPNSGEITLSGECSLPDAQGMGTLLENADGNSWTSYVDNGVLTAYTADQITAKATVPSYQAAWSNSTFTWEDTRVLADAQAETWDTVRDARDANLAAGFTWDGSKFDSDDVSIQRIQGAVTLAQLALAANQSFSIVWTLFDNTTRTLSGTDMINVYLALGTFTQNIFTAGVNLRNQINATTDVNQLHSITWATIS